MNLGLSLGLGLRLSPRKPDPEVKFAGMYDILALGPGKDILEQGAYLLVRLNPWVLSASTLHAAARDFIKNTVPTGQRRRAWSQMISHLHTAIATTIVARRPHIDCSRLESIRKVLMGDCRNDEAEEE